MAHRQIIFVAMVLLLSICSTTIASDSPATSFVVTTCNDATYTNLCLDTLLPNADRINGNSKKATRLALSAILPQIQTTSDSIDHLAEQPQLWTREVNALNQCESTITSSFTGVMNALQATNQLGGGTKSDKESKRLSMENNVKTVLNATNTCTANLQQARARDEVIARVHEATQQLVQLATNAKDLIHRLEF